MRITTLIGALALLGAAVVACAKSASLEQEEGFVMPVEGIATGFVNKYIDGASPRRYVVYVPFEYTPEKSWPLIVFLHGAGERGDDGLIPTEVGIGTAIRRNPERFPAIVLIPQCPKDVLWDSAMDDVERAMEKTNAEYNIDLARVYLTGLSMGGYGTWLWGAENTDRFAALMPLCGGGDPKDLQRLSKEEASDYGSFDERIRKLAKVPIFAFHGADDSAVPVEKSRRMVKALEAAGGNIKYTEYEGVDHNCWDRTYGDADVINWLFEQRLTPGK